MKKLLILLLLFLYPVSSIATIDERKTDVYFANGIKTEKRDAINNSGLLRVAIKDKFGLNYYNSHIGEVSYAYNQTANLEADLLESLLQKFGRDWLTNLFIPSHKTDLSRQVTKYENSIKSGHRVLVVAHSQGNLYTYEAGTTPQGLNLHF